MRSKKVLVVEDDPKERVTISETFIRSGYMVTTAPDTWSALKEIDKESYDLVISELCLPQVSGMELLKKVKKLYEFLPVILISSGAEVKEAVEVMKLGANDFILKPLTQRMIEIIGAQLSNGGSLTDKGKPEERYNIITKNREMKLLLQEAEKIANSRASICVQGESGTGKELFARYIHHCSQRSNGPFVAINCSAIPETLLESELFGHERGSFTGALRRKKGKFEIANHGTILLDEISELDVQLQSKLLRVLQEREIEIIGGNSPIPVDIRIIATTNRDIEKQIREGKFREDLYYRLNVVQFHLPPLRERRDDIPILADYFVKKYNRIDKRSVKGLTESAVQLLMQMPWKGNVRELENVIERAILMCKGDLVDKEDLITTQKNSQNEDLRFNHIPTFSLKEAEKKIIYHALDKTNGNRTHAAELLGISVRTLRNKLHEYRNRMAAQ